MSIKSKYIFFFILLFSVGYNFAQCSDPDTDDPLIVAPPDLNLANDPGECFAALTAAQLSYPTTYDGCGVISTLPSNIPPNYEFPVGTTVVTWTATDAAGNSGTATQTVVVTDQEAPVVNCPATINVTTNPGDCDAYVNVVATASDNCAVSSVSNDNTSGGLDASGTYPIGTTTVTFTVTDGAGYSSNCTVDVNVVNSDSPTITLLGASNITLEACDPYNELGATATDTCLGDISSNITIDTSALNTSAVGTYNVVYTVVNAAGIPSSPVIRTVNVVDTTPPSLTLIGPSTLTIGNCSTYTELGAESLDSCLGDISGNVVINNSSVDTSVLGSYTVTYSVVDDNGNSGGSITRTVEVVDNTPPDIVLLGDNPQTLEACAGYTELGATAIDPCFGTDFSSSLIIDTSAVNFSVVGTYQVTYNVVDNFSNPAIEVIRTINIVDTTPPTLTLVGDNPQIVSACTPYAELGATAIDPCTNVDYTSSITIDDSALDVNTEGIYPVTYSVCDATGNCATTITRNVEVVLGNSSADAGNDFTNSICTDTTINLNATAVIGTQASGLWTVTSGQTSGFSFSDATSNTSTFTGDVGETYTLTWTIDNPDPCADVSDTITVTFINCSALDFDGNDDNITFRNNYNLTSDFTLEVWIKSDNQNNNIQTIFSKREAFNLVDGYDLRVVDGYVSFHWNNGESLISPYRIDLNKWHHIAVTQSSGTYKLYIDGIEMSTTSGSIPLSNSHNCLVGAMHQNTNAPFAPLHYFEGGMDELRIWDIALTQTQIRKMMNQEITDLNPSTSTADGFVYGSEVPLQVMGINWATLNGYYRMNQSSDLSSGNLVASNGSAVSGLLRYMTTLQPETAPLPYISNNNGNWTTNTTWLHGTVQNIPNSLGIDNSTKINWNIVRTAHNITSGNNNIIVLGLNVDSNTLTIENTDATDGQSLRVTDYLILNGTLKLVGESQLLQDTGSIVDYNGAGVLQRDQQGTSNLYNYNYWGTPVSTDGSSYTVGSILHEGTQPVLWTTAHNANPNTSPITMSSRWLYLYENYPVNSYADWQAINEGDNANVSLGFLMKGSGASTSTQNYTFIGKPNNGTYTTPITANYEALIGNPYPSAIDAHEFIFDNSSSMLGTLYFWEHYDSNDTHVLADYQGGFATYNLTGGNPAVSPPEVSGLGTPLRIPERYIPVAQGFTVEANPTGGVITFENDQRVFVKEAVTGAADNGSVFIRNANHQNANTEDDPIQRIRLRFDSPEEASRHLLLGFVPNNQADDGFNYGYDAPNTDELPSDMSWVIEDAYYVIQGVGEFDITKMYPLFIKLAEDGPIQIEITALENFDSEIDVYVYDALIDISFNINNAPYQYTLPAGEYLDRFYITFQPSSQLSVDEVLKEQFSISYILDIQEIHISLPNLSNTKQVQLLNMLGQTVYTWQQDQLHNSDGFIKIPVPKIAEGTYVVQVNRANGQTLTKKIVVSN